MVPTILAILCGLLIWHFQRFSIRAWKLVPACLVPLAMTALLGFFGLLVSALYTGAMVRLDVQAA